MEPCETLPLKIPLFSQNDFHPLSRIIRDMMEIQVSYCPLKDFLSLEISMHKEAMKTLEVFLVDLGDPKTVAISSIRRPNFFISKKRKREKIKRGLRMLSLGMQEGHHVKTLGLFLYLKKVFLKIQFFHQLFLLVLLEN